MKKLYRHFIVFLFKKSTQTRRKNHNHSRVVSPQFVKGTGRSGLETGPLTSYGLPIVTVGLSLTVFAVLRLVTDRQTDGTGLTKSGKMHSPAKN